MIFFIILSNLKCLADIDNIKVKNAVKALDDIFFLFFFFLGNFKMFFYY